MHHIAPFPIIIGIVGVIFGLLWLSSAGAEDDGGPSAGMFFAFGWIYIAIRVLKQLSKDPMSVLPGFGFLLGGGALIWLGAIML